MPESHLSRLEAALDAEFPPGTELQCTPDQLFGGNREAYFRVFQRIDAVTDGALGRRYGPEGFTYRPILAILVAARQAVSPEGFPAPQVTIVPAEASVPASPKKSGEQKPVSPIHDTPVGLNGTHQVAQSIECVSERSAVRTLSP